MTEYDQRFRTILENRHEVLQYLRSHSATISELVDALDTLRSTIDRASRDLTEIGCVTESGAEYVATTTGCLAVEAFEYYQTKTRLIQETREFLNILPDDTSLDTGLLTGATITLAEDHAPDQALYPSIDIFEDATALKGLAPVVLTFYPDLIVEQLRQNDLTVEIIAETTVLKTLPKLASSQVDPLLDHDAVSLFEANSSLPYAL